MAVGYGTAAVFVTFGLITLVMGVEFTVIGLLYNKIVPMYVAYPMVGIGFASTLLGYILFFVLGKQYKADLYNNLIQHTA